ncbi:hypothetical protein CVT26_005745, partial [Gymnopilus dilepis]
GRRDRPITEKLGKRGCWNLVPSSLIGRLLCPLRSLSSLTTMPPRRRDKLLKPLQGIIRSLSPLPRQLSEGDLSSTPISPSDHHSSNTAPPTPNATLTSQPATAPGSPRKSFTKSQSFEKDIALLHASFILQKDPQLREVILVILAICDGDKEDRFASVLEKCTSFVVQLATAPEAHQAEAAQALAEFKGVVEKVKAEIEEKSMSSDVLSTMLTDEIGKVKPPFLCDDDDRSQEQVSKFIDVALSSSITILNLMQSASSLIPVPWVQPLVAQIIVMLKAVSQTRANYDKMKEIATTAGKFAVSCAVICSEKSPGPSTEFQRALDKFTKEIKTIAQECDELSRRGLFSRYLKQSSHATDLQRIKEQLQDAIILFQIETQLTIKMDTEVLKRNVDHVSLDGLPSHPRYDPNDYLDRSRDDAIESISDWITNANESVLWMHGAAGLGKSTVAQQLIHLLQDDDRLAGAVLLTFLTKEHPSDVVRMIARQLGEKHPRAVSDIAEAARKLNSAHDSLGDYLTTYIINPIRALRYPYPLVIVVDGLDEWSSRDSFLKALKDIPLPSPVKFILTSRISHAIEGVLKEVNHHPYPLPPASQEVIERYFDHHFDQDGIDWTCGKPDQQKIRRLAALADGLLIWAATVRSTVQNDFDGRPPDDIVDSILLSEESAGTNRQGLLARLYQHALSGLFPSDLQIRKKVRDFLGGSVALQEAVPIDDFARLSGLEKRPTREIHRRLAALRLHDGVDSDFIKPALQSYHASFLDFVQAEPNTQSPDDLWYYIAIKAAHLTLAQSCLRIVFHNPVAISRSKPNSVEQYAVRFWPYHLSNGTERTDQQARMMIEMQRIQPSDLYLWITLFLPLVLTHPPSAALESGIASSSEVFHKLAMLTEGKVPNAQLYHLPCLEIAVRLKSNNIQTWIALGTAYQAAYKGGSDRRNLDHEIVVLQNALQLTAGVPTGEDTGRDHAGSDQVVILTDLGKALRVRFERFGKQDDLKDAILKLGKALELSPPGHPNRFSSLYNFATILHTCSEQSGSLDDLNKAIQMHNEALKLLPDANALQTRFDQFGSKDDLDEAILKHREALGLHLRGHPELASSLNNLANALYTRGQRSGSQKDLDDAIVMYRGALEFRPSGHPDRAGSLSNLSIALQTSFEQYGSQKDLEEAILKQYAALELRPRGHPDHSLSLNNLANALYVRFRQSGSQKDLDEVILIHQEAFEHHPSSHSGRFMSSFNLATALKTRFNLSGLKQDLNEAISMYREALKHCPYSHPNHSTLLNDLGLALSSRFDRFGGRTEDLDEAIIMHSGALKLRPRDPTPHPDRWASLANLGTCLRTRASTVNDVEEAITHHREAISLCSTSHPVYANLISDLVSDMELHFNKTSNEQSLDEAIVLYQRLAELTTGEATKQSWALTRWSKALRKRFALHNNPEDLKKAEEIDKSLTRVEDPTANHNKRSQLGDVISLITAIRDVDKDGHLANVFETCARFAVQLASATEAHRAEAAQAMAEFVRTMEELKAQIIEDPTLFDTLSTRVNDEIERIKPSFLRNAEAMPLEDFSLFLDAALGRGITVLSILESASLFIPVPFVYPTISQVLYMMKAAEQTRANLNEMKARAEEFAVLTASAVVLPGKTSDLSEGGGLGDFARELEAIALECNRLRQQPRLVRYVLPQSHARELQALNNRLVDTIRRLQVCFLPLIMLGMKEYYSARPDERRSCERQTGTPGDLRWRWGKAGAARFSKITTTYHQPSLPLDPPAMATDGKRNRKRDKFLRPFSGIVRSISREPPIASRPDILDEQPRTVTDSSANTTLNLNAYPPETSASVEASRPFSKGKSFEQDVAALYISFALQENIELKKAFKLIITVRNNDEKDQLVDVLGKCAQFAVQLASSSERESRRAEVTQAITDLEWIMERMREAQLAGDTECLKTLSFSVDELITKTKQTRSNYNDMREIATIAGEFAVSCAIICSESPEGPSTEFKRSLDRFTKKLEGIARECIERSQIGLFSRYFQRNVHANDLQSIKTRLKSSIEIFQNETEVNIKLDTEALKRNLDFASLNTLPSHPRYERSEYLENSRDDVIEYVSRWISDASELVLWIHGPAGMGKSTVAQQLIYLLQQEDRLAGGVLLTLVAQEHPAEIIRMIAKQLGEKHPHAIPEVAEAARKLNSVHDSLRDYLTTYIINPIRQLKYPYQLIILIDGLDEWRNLEPFIQEVPHIPSPSPVKFILTSRFNHTIDRVLSKASVHKYSLPSVPQPVMERYFHLHFASDEIDWQGRRPDEHKIRQLAILADGLLVWAATVRSLVLNKFDQRHPHEILDDIITSEVKVVSKGGRRLECLYRNALLALFPPDIHGALRDFLGAILVLQEALPLSDFAHLMRNHISERGAKEIHRSLAALRLRGDPESEIVSPAIGSYHSSFLEFIQSGFTAIGDGEPSNQSMVSRDAHLKLGQACINVIFRDFLPSFKGQTCSSSELSILECYSVKFWPLHLSNGTERTSREADSALANVSSTALRRWATLFLPQVSRRLIDEGRNLNIPTTSELFAELSFLVESRNATAPPYFLHFLELSVRRQPQNVLTWISLGTSHHWVYRRLRDGHNLEEAITVFRHALKLIGDGLSGDEPTLMTTGFIPEDNDSDADISTIPNFGRKNKVLMCLADALEARFERIGTLTDLDEAIALHREALDLYLASHPHRPFQSLNNFARALQARFRQRGELSDIDEAVRVLREALQLRSPPHPDFWLLSGNLAYVLQIRFEGRGDFNSCHQSDQSDLHFS